MNHLTLVLLVLSVDALVPHTHHTHLSRRYPGHPETLDVFPRSSHAMNPVDPLVDFNYGSSKQVQAQQLKREVTDRDWAHAASVETSSIEPERGVNYLSKTGPGPAKNPPHSISVTESSVDPATTSTSLPADPLYATSPSHAAKTSHNGKGPQHHHKGDPKHHAGRRKKMMKKAMKL